MHPKRLWLIALFIAMAIAYTSASRAERPEQTLVAMVDPSAVGRESISARVSLGCQQGAGFIARVLAQAGGRSATRFALGNGFIAIYSDGSWIHVAEFEQPCIVASGSQADMTTYFDAE